MTIRWPVGVLRPQNVAFDIAPRSLAAPSSVSGQAQVVSADAGIWKATYGSLLVRSRASVIVHRAISNLLEGRLGAILVPLCRAYQPTLDIDGIYDTVPHDDDSPFDDESEYQGGGNLVTLSSGISARAVSANVTIAYGGTLEPGQHFSLGDRLYRLRTVVYTTETAAAITFRPPAREAVSEGVELNFDDPVCRMRLASDDAMDLELAMRRFGSPTVNFIEDL